MVTREDSPKTQKSQMLQISQTRDATNNSVATKKKDTAVHELNTSLYKKLKNNASVIGKRLTNKSAPRGHHHYNNTQGAGKSGPGSMIVSHHPLYPRQDSRPDTSFG